MKSRLVVAVLCAMLGTYTAYTLFYPNAGPPVDAQESAVTPPPAAPPPLAATPVSEPLIVHPLLAEPGVTALPALEMADAVLIKALGKVLSGELLALIVPDELIRRIVATVDNLPRQQLPASLVPLKRAPGAFVTSGSSETLSIDASNSQRYTTIVQLIESVDSVKLVALYRQFYPLFQRAYAQLGYPQAYFNDRLVEAIDDLLAAPELGQAAQLVQPKVLYEFADPELQARSAGQRIMMRIGTTNAAPLKAKLREIRQQVARAAVVR